MAEIVALIREQQYLGRTWLLPPREMPSSHPKYNPGMAGTGSPRRRSLNSTPSGLRCCTITGTSAGRVDGLIGRGDCGIDLFANAGPRWSDIWIGADVQVQAQIDHKLLELAVHPVEFAQPSQLGAPRDHVFTTCSCPSSDLDHAGCNRSLPLTEAGTALRLMRGTASGRCHPRGRRAPAVSGRQFTTPAIYCPHAAHGGHARRPGSPQRCLRSAPS